MTDNFGDADTIWVRVENGVMTTIDPPVDDDRPKDNSPMLSQGHRLTGDEPMLGGDRKIEVRLNRLPVGLVWRDAFCDAPVHIARGGIFRQSESENEPVAELEFVLLTAGEDLSRGDVVYLDADGKVRR